MIKLLCQRGNFPAGTIVTFDAGTEAGLIAANLASADLTGGTKWVEPRVAEALSQAFSGDGKLFTLGARPKISIVGNSQVANTLRMGYEIAPAAVIPGVSDVAKLGFERSWPQGVADVEFVIVNGKKLIRARALSESFGEFVDITTGGVFMMRSSGGAGCLIRTRARSFGNANVTTTANVTGTVYHQYASGNIAGMLDALTGHRFEIVQPLLGVGGDAQMDFAARRQQVLDQNAPIIWFIDATNTLFAVNMSADDALALELANYQWAAAAGRIVISTAVLPRFGSDGGGDPISATPANTAKLAKYNAGLMALARQYPNWYVVTGDPAADLANNWVAKVGTTSDGLHGKAGLFASPVRQVADICNRVFPPSQGAPKLGSAAQLYSATDNPRGNLVNSGAGSFIGTGGTVGVGMALATAWAATTAQAAEDVVIAGGRAYRVVTAGTTGSTAPVHTAGVATDGTAQLQFICTGASVGLAANWNFRRSVGASALGKLFKYTDENGEGQAVFVTSGADDDIFEFYTDSVTAANFSTGDVIDAGIDFDVTGNGCRGVSMNFNPNGAMTTGSAIAALQCDANVLGFSGKATPCIPPGLVWDATGTTSIRYRCGTRTAAGAAYLMKLSNAFIRKVL